MRTQLEGGALNDLTAALLPFACLFCWGHHSVGAMENVFFFLSRAKTNGIQLSEPLIADGSTTGRHSAGAPTWASRTGASRWRGNVILYWCVPISNAALWRSTCRKKNKSHNDVIRQAFVKYKAVLYLLTCIFTAFQYYSLEWSVLVLVGPWLNTGLV